MNLESLAHDVVALYRLNSQPIKVSLCRGKRAKSVDEILEGLDPDIERRAEDVRLLEQDYNRQTQTLRYKATSGDNTYSVIVRAALSEGSGEKKVSEISDIYLSCSCRHWRYGGCEYHAYQGKYLYQPEDSRGTLEPPVVRDPENDNFVCKHVYKALQEAKTLYIESPLR